MSKYPMVFAGTFGLYHTQDHRLLVIKRTAKDDDEGKYGLPGGYMNFHALEQPKVACRREGCEEIIMPDRSSLLEVLKAWDFHLLETGVDYTRTENDGSFQSGTLWQAFSIDISHIQPGIEMYVKTMKEDPTFRGCVQMTSKGEIETVLLLRPEEVMALIGQFAYPHEAKMARRYAEQYLLR